MSISISSENSEIDINMRNEDFNQTNNITLLYTGESEKSISPTTVADINIYEDVNQLMNLRRPYKKRFHESLIIETIGQQERSLRPRRSNSSLKFSDLIEEASPKKVGRPKKKISTFTKSFADLSLLSPIRFNIIEDIQSGNV